MLGNMFDFDYDSRKAATNLQKHGVAFAEAESVFLDPLAATLLDQDHSYEEQRFITVGMSLERRVLFVVYTEDDSGMRLIGCTRCHRDRATAI